MIKEEIKNLIERIKAGIDKEAEREILTLYGPRIEKKVNYYLGQNIQERLDVINESKLGVILSLREGKFDPSKGSPLGSYVHGVTNNKIKDYLKNHRIYQTTTLDDIEDEHQDADIFTELDSSELKNRIKKCLSTLDIKYQEVLYLRFFDNLTISEISEKIDLPPKRVSERIHYALTKLKKSVKKRKYFQYFCYFF